MNRETVRLLVVARPGTIRRKLKELATQHRTIRMLTSLIDLVFRLDIGSLHVTVQTRASVSPYVIRRLLRAHRRGEWGDVPLSQQRFNDTANAVHSGTIHSTYAAEGQEVHVLTFSCFCARWVKRWTLVCLKSELLLLPCECMWMGCPVTLTPQNAKLIPPHVREALCNVLAYLWSEEVESYDSGSPEEGCNHIKKDAGIVTDWLQGPNQQPTDLDKIVK